MPDPASSIGYSDRDLIIQTKTLVESVVGDISEIKIEQAALRTDVDALKTAQAVDSAKKGRGIEFKHAVYALSVLAAYWFGPVIDKAITH